MIDKDGLTLIQYFNRRIADAVFLKDYIGSITIKAWEDTSYGRTYYYVEIDTMLLNGEDDLKFPEVKQKVTADLLQFIGKESSSFGSYLLEGNEYSPSEKGYWDRLYNFYQIYNVMCTVALDTLSRNFPISMIKIDSLEEESKFWFVKRYFDRIRYSRNTYEDYFDTEIEADINQFENLSSIIKISQKLRKSNFIVSDTELMEQLYSGSLFDLRKKLIDYEIPMNFADFGIESAIHFDIRMLKSKIENEGPSNPDSFYNFNEGVNKLYTLCYQKSQGNPNAGLKYRLEVGDVVLLANDEVYRITDINKYRRFSSLLGSKMGPKFIVGKRTEYIYIEEIEKVIKSEDFEQGIREKTWFSIKSFIRFMRKKKDVNLIK
ncbi:hypothetical protein [Sphingobacterium sp. BIGb0165]|uniref:hypothetical protein n=1 Tax=Sphingobacterium sp. BIGb0165 TaxID=2940615 RepID=UPI00216A4035|nr:hypothetical protein [Sphingobacterium sp. BIGb0165]MCS4224680.1 hypothetical protein [Sphingobacterium sp. BIGb0165]